MKPTNTDDVEPVVVTGQHWDNTGLRDRLAEEEVAGGSIVGDLHAAMAERQSEGEETIIDLRDGKRRRIARRRKSRD